MIRIVEKKYPETRKVKARTPDGQFKQGRLSNVRVDEPTQIKTIGWKPGCKCLSDDITPGPHLDDGVRLPFDPIPCTILDPFSGSGTTGVESTRLGRHSILIELNPDYVQMSVNRIAPIQFRIQQVKEGKKEKEGLLY